MATSAEAVQPALEGTGEKNGYDPKDLREAYKLPETGASGQTVAIVDAYNDPNAYSDLKTYRKTYKLSECTEESGCFKKVNQKGETKNYPSNSAEWSVEISLDLDMVSATCSGCHILLVEAETNSWENLGKAENEAASLGATVISNSYGGKEFNEERAYDPYYDHPGIPITVAAGDSGYGSEYPASSPYVISVGGTALKKEEKTRGWSEEVWRNTEYKVGERGAGTGSGCSIEEPKPGWQHDTGCSYRTDTDVAAVASTKTPVSVYDSYETIKAWENYGGTSAAAPIVAGIEGLAEGPARSLGAEIFYDQPTSEFAVTKGNDGSCGISYLCTAGEGYNAPAGMGAPDGVPKALPIAEDTSPSAALEPSTGYPSIYYVDSKHEIAYWTYTTSGWTNGVIGGSVEASTSPTAIDDSTETLVYFVNKSGEIDTWAKTTGAWSEYVLGGSVESGTSPSAFDVGSELHVAYINKNKEVAEWRYVGPWTDTTLGGSVEAGTSPTAIYDSNDSEMVIYFVNKSGEVDTWAKTTGVWGEIVLGGGVESGTSPSAFDVGSELHSAYIKSSKEVAEWRYVGPWTDTSLGGSVEEGTSPTTTYDSSTGLSIIYFDNANGEIDTWAKTTGVWAEIALGGSVEFGTSPVAIQTSGGELRVYYAKQNGEIAEWRYGGPWANATL